MSTETITAPAEAPGPVDVAGIYIPDEMCWVHITDVDGGPEAELWLREGTQHLATVLRLPNGHMVLPGDGRLVARVGFAHSPEDAWKKACA
jgi:hypothetical protein